MAINTIDSSLTGLAYVEEESLKVLPASPKWQALEPNDYSDFGADVKTIARDPINAARQRSKGALTDVDAKAGFSTDLTQNNMTDLLQGFMFADIQNQVSTKPLSGASVAVTDVDGTANSALATSGLDIFSAGELVKLSGFGVSANNTMAKVTSASATSVAVDAALSDEVGPPATARIDRVGFSCPSGDLSVAASGAYAVLTSAGGVDFTALGLAPGHWLFVGGDTASSHFDANAGYGRIKSISATSVTLSSISWTASAESGTGKEVQLFFGSHLRNMPTVDTIVRRSYHLERQLGNDGNGLQAEYLVGAIPNEFGIKMPSADKVTADLSFVGMDTKYVDGTEGLIAGDRLPGLGEAPINTSTDLIRARMTLGTDEKLFTYLTEANLSINNGVTPNKALGVLGAFEASAGTFEVGGSVTAYFTSVAAIRALRANADVALDYIFGARNSGILIDVPLLTVGGGRPTIEKGQPIKLPLETAAAKNDEEYTLSITMFDYLPDAAMAS